MPGRTAAAGSGSRRWPAPPPSGRCWSGRRDFRKLKPSLGDAFTVHGASYVRPPVEPLGSSGLQAMDTFTWHGREFWCLETAGNSPAACPTCSTREGWLAFSGDVMLAGPDA